MFWLWQLTATKQCFTKIGRKVLECNKASFSTLATVHYHFCFPGTGASLKRSSDSRKKSAPQMFPFNALLSNLHFLSNCRQVGKEKQTQNMGPFTSLQCILFLIHAEIHYALDASDTQPQMHFLSNKRNQETRTSSTTDFLSYHQYLTLKCPSVGTGPFIYSQVLIFCVMLPNWGTAVSLFMPYTTSNSQVQPTKPHSLLRPVSSTATVAA